MNLRNAGILKLLATTLCEQNTKVVLMLSVNGWMAATLGDPNVDQKGERGQRMVMSGGSG